MLRQRAARAYEQEKGKRLATTEDIDNVLREIKVVTHETETIKAQIGTDAWTRQMVWHQKREAYFKILTRAQSLKDSLVLLLTTRLSSRFVSVDSLQGHFDEFTRHASDYVTSNGRFHDALLEAEIFVNRDAISLMAECRKPGRLGGVIGMLPLNPSDLTQASLLEDDVLNKKGQDEIDFLAGRSKQLVLLAKEDLGKTQ